MYMFQILQDNNGSSLCLKLNSAVKKNIGDPKSLSIVFGQKKVTVTVHFSDSINERELFLSTDALNILDIPTASPYEILFTENKMIVGPYIGILASVTDTELPKMIPILSGYVKHYDKIGGTIIAFSLEGIQQETEKIKGLIYLPQSKDWIPGTFSYPSSVFSIVETSLTENWSSYLKIMKHLQGTLGSRIFNYPNFDKWKMYQLLQKNLGDYLPKTIIYRKSADVKNMLRNYKSLYIKPINGRLGRYVLKLTRISNGVIVEYGRKAKVFKHFISWRKLSNFLETSLNNGSYLIQQSIDLFSYQNQIIDFRIMMVKNEYDSWENVGAIARYGVTNSIVSNVTAGGKAEIGSKTLRTVFKYTKNDTEKLISQINNMIMTALDDLEAYGYQLGNLGFDIGIDKNGRVWIIEINNQNPDHYIAVRANNRGLFYKAKLKNMLYAKLLSISHD